MEFNNSKRMELINTMVTELPVLRARIGASQADISEKIAFQGKLIMQLKMVRKN